MFLFLFVKILKVLNSKLAIKREINITVTPNIWVRIKLSPSSKMAVTIVTMGSIFNITLV